MTKLNLLGLLLFILAGCHPAESMPTSTPVMSSTSTFTPSLTFTPTPLPPTSTFTQTPTPTPSATWSFYAEVITCPILLYHHVAPPPDGGYSLADRYYISPDIFQVQMSTLQEWGYATITISDLVEAIRIGAALPPRPIVITFDDGYTSVYMNAAPIMEQHGFSGTAYIIGNAIDSQPDYMTAEQLQDLIAHGWEIGSHSMTHPDLRNVYDQINFEAGWSRTDIGARLGVEINSFAYPYGQMDSFVASKIVDYGYTSAVGLGTAFTHDHQSLYYLSRIEIRNDYGMDTFTSILPWSGQP